MKDYAPISILLLCWALGTLLSALHACIENSTGAALESYAEQRRGRVVGARLAAIRGIIADLPGHGHAVALGRILCNLGVAVASVFVVASTHTAQSEPLNPTTLDAAIGVCISAAALWITSVALAESIGRHLPERFLFTFGPMVRVAYLIQRPLNPFAALLDTMVRKIAGAEHVSKTEEVSEEIISVVEEGEREGLIDEGERRMIEAVVNFKHRTVEQIMTPRNEIEALEYTNNLGAITAFVRKVRHSRIPVYKADGGLDDVIGFFYVKDLLRWLAGDLPRIGPATGPASQINSGGGLGNASGGFDLKCILRPALHVPDSKTIRELADEFVTKKVHVAVVVDEYGALTGLVSLEDIIEDVFGDIQDEYEKTEDEPARIEVKPDGNGEDGSPRGGLADIDARVYITAANEALEPLGSSLPESDDYDTVGGFVLSTLGHMPEVNETFSHGRMSITVLEASPTRVLRVRVKVAPDEHEADRSETAAERAK
ncbi:MAG TPA: hemolysin family protein [Phycisphaerales bacterium]|nr:hemolysin family protein [Phycisphaerales bacterium]